MRGQRTNDRLSACAVARWQFRRPSHGARLFRASDLNSTLLSRDYSVGIQARPHPGLLPQGEGELFPALEKVHRLVSFSESAIGGSLSWGEGQGEGERYF